MQFPGAYTARCNPSSCSLNCCSPCCSCHISCSFRRDFGSLCPAVPFLLQARVRLPGMSGHWFYQCTSGPCHPNATHFLGAPFAVDGSISAGYHPSAHRDHSSRDLFRTLCQTSLLILCPPSSLAARYPAPLPKWYQCTRPGFGPATQWLPFSNPSPASSVLPSWSPCCLPNIRDTAASQRLSGPSA